MRVEVKHLGCAGHFICAASCRYRRHTQVGDAYRVSTVGDYMAHVPGEEPEVVRRQTIGAGPADFFETYVFETLPEAEENSEGCGCHAVKSWSEIDGARWATAAEAHAGHEAFVEKYVRLLEDAAPTAVVMEGEE